MEVEDTNLLDFFAITSEMLIPITSAIDNSEYRVQILHHAAASELNSVLYIDATATKITRIVIVLFKSRKKNRYADLLLKIKDKYMKWIYDQLTPPEFSSEVLGFCRDNHTLRTTLALWKAAYKLYIDGDCLHLPFGKHISEGLLNAWNYCKGGVDVLTRLKSNNSAAFQHLGVEGRLWDLLVTQTIVTIATIYKWTLVEGNLGNCETTDQLKSHFNKISVKQLLINIAKEFRCRTEKLKDSIVENEVQKNLDSGANVKKWSQKMFSSTDGKKILAESNHLFGTTKSCGQCSVCSQQTAYYCKVCNTRLCVMKHGRSTDCCYEYFHDLHQLKLERTYLQKRKYLEESADEEGEDKEEEEEVSTCKGVSSNMRVTRSKK